MIDLHTHILPFLDDGAEDMEESVSMLRMAEESGTQVVVTTPHCNIPGFFENKQERIRQVFNDVKSELERQKIGVTLVGGMEIFATDDVPEKLCEGKLLTLNNTKYPLIEFDFYEEEGYIFFLLERVIEKGYVPIVAHPERYNCFAENPEALFELYKMGAVIQINKGSVLGAFGEKAEFVSDVILSHRLATVAASDAHSCVSRTTSMAPFAEYIDEKYGDGCSPLLLEENPKRILQNKDVFWEKPIPFY